MLTPLYLRIPWGILDVFLRRSNNRILNKKNKLFWSPKESAWGGIGGLTFALMIKCIAFITCVRSKLFADRRYETLVFLVLGLNLYASLLFGVSEAWIFQWSICSSFLIYACAAKLWRLETSVCYVLVLLGVFFRLRFRQNSRPICP